jgi:LPXTG-motif cell wall-anchored protein
MDSGGLTWSARPEEWGGGEDESTLRARGEEMQSIVGIVFLVIGVILIIFGMQASASLGSRLSELFTGAPSDRTIWLLVAGVAAAILGLGLLLVGRRRTL